jgi:hypothetical protein
MTMESGQEQPTSPSTPVEGDAEEDTLLPPRNVDRWTLMRDVTVFQGKLILDGLRDLLLSPISIAAALIGIVAGGDRPGRQFYDLLYLGKRSESWINLFGAASHVSPPPFDKEGGESVDDLVDRLEDVARQQYEKGGLTQNAKDAVDRALDAVNKGLKNTKKD